MTMTHLLQLPQLSGGPARARALVEAAKLPADLGGAKIVVDCRQLRAGTAAFADELVRILLVDRHADAVEAINVSSEFEGYLAVALRRHRLTAE